MRPDGPVVPAFPLAGLRSDSLGRYLAALGLMRTAARKWPHVRGAWRDGCFWLVGGPAGLDEMVDHLLSVEWSPYERSWKKAQEGEKKRRKGAPSPYALWLSEQDEGTTELALAHLVVSSTRYFNPLLGSGGNSGRREFSKGWSDAARAVEGLPAGWDKADARRELTGFLAGSGGPVRRGHWQAGSWYSDLSMSEHGASRLSPWAMLLACEALPLFAGAPSRRLGASTRRLGAFPFVTASAAPTTSGEAGRDHAEVWTPLWSRPMTLPELHALFRRGRAELGGRGAVTPAAMAAAIVSRGVDAGVVGFVRHALGGTTSGNTFEPRRIGRIDLIPSLSGPASALSTALTRIVDLCERLPGDVRKKQRWIFRGLRGPIEAAVTGYAARPADPEAAKRLLDALVLALDRVEANRSFRERSVEFDLLPLEWLRMWLGSGESAAELRLAMGAASLLDEPFLVHRWSVSRTPGTATRYRFTKERQARCVWTIGPVADNLVRILQRRLVDADHAAKGSESLPTRATVNVSRGDLRLWLAHAIDEGELARWVDRLALFDWRSMPNALRSMHARVEEAPPVDGRLVLCGLLRPLLDRRRLAVSGKPLFEDHADPRTAGVGRSLVARLAVRDLDGAVDIARSRYHMAGRPLGRVRADLSVDDPIRLASALLFQPFCDELIGTTARWLRPIRNEGGP